MVSWADAQESDEEMEGTEETSKRQKVQMIEAALQVVNEECTEFTGGGEELDPVKLLAGRKDEEEFMTKHDVFEEISAEECWRDTGKAPTSTRWVDAKKTLDDGVEIVRSRLVGRDFKMKGGDKPEHFFAATSPRESKKLLFKMSMVNPKEGKLETKLMFIDVRKAHFTPVCNEKVFVELPDGRVVRMKKWLYGMRKAASSWEELYTEKFVEKGFQPGSSCPVVFFNKETAVRVVVHGDDFSFSGHHLELVALRNWMESWCDIKFRGIMGSGRDDTKEIEILGRRLRRTNKGLELEASRNPRLKLLRDFGMNEDSKGMSSRKSTSGGVLSIAGTAMKSWNSRQGSVATSVASAEYHAALKGAAEDLGFASLARDLGYELKVILWSDSTAARGVAARKGLSSRTRHMEVKFLWLQGALAKRAAGLEKSAYVCQPC